MKIIALGDIHGRTIWKRIVQENDFDKIIFIGDYFDSHDGISAAQQKKNFKEILSYKKRNPEKVVLLIGNHDFHYLENIDETYSGYQEKQSASIQVLLQPAVDEGLLQMCFRWKQLLFTHAGVTETWRRNNNISRHEPEMDINELFKNNPDAFAFTPGRYYDTTGDEVEQTPIWVRPDSLLKDSWDTWIQVVGHTVQKKLECSGYICFIDTLGTSGEYLIYEDEKFSVRETIVK